MTRNSYETSYSKTNFAPLVDLGVFAAKAFARIAPWSRKDYATR